MAIQIGKPAEHGFDEPLGLLGDCHRGIEWILSQSIGREMADRRGVPFRATIGR